MDVKNTMQSVFSLEVSIILKLKGTIIRIVRNHAEKFSYDDNQTKDPKFPFRIQIFNFKQNPFEDVG